MVYPASSLKPKNKFKLVNSPEAFMPKVEWRDNGAGQNRVVEMQGWKVKKLQLVQCRV